MKSTQWLNRAAGLAIFGLLALPIACAQQGPGPGQRARMYNPANEITLKGAVEEVKTVTGRHGWDGTHLTLSIQNSVTDVQERVEKGKVVSEVRKTEGRTVDVHLGPASFLKDKGFSFAKGDKIQVTGSKVEYLGAEALVAREVRKGDKTLVLRNAQGIPEWSGGMRR